MAQSKQRRAGRARKAASTRGHGGRGGHGCRKGWQTGTGGKPLAVLP